LCKLPHFIPDKFANPKTTKILLFQIHLEKFWGECAVTTVFSEINGQPQITINSSRLSLTKFGCLCKLPLQIHLEKFWARCAVTTVFSEINSQSPRFSILRSSQYNIPECFCQTCQKSD